MNIPRGLFLVLRLFALLTVACGNQGSGSAENDLVDPDDLSLVALRVKQAMTREQVIDILGPATWAALPGDQGDFAVRDPQTSLILFWRNPGLAVVEVHFDHDQKVRWDGGKPIQGPGGYSHFFEPSTAFECSLPDRSNYCKK